MAPADTPRQKNRGDQYFEVGVKGRKTGIVLEEVARDEYGMEDVNKIFSSPTKATPTANGRASLAGDDEFNRVDPALKNTLAQGRQSSLLPPSARPPRRTNLKTPPRRPSSVGMSSPFHPSNRKSIRRPPPPAYTIPEDSPARVVPADQMRATINSSPRSTPKVGAKVNGSSGSLPNGSPLRRKKKTKGLVQMKAASEEDVEEDNDAPDLFDATIEDFVNGTLGDVPGFQDESLIESEPMDLESDAIAVPEHSQSTKKQRRERPPGHTVDEGDSTSTSNSKKRPRGRPAASLRHDKQSPEHYEQIIDEDEGPVAKKARGRPKTKRSAPTILIEDEENAPDEATRPAKKPRGRPAKSQISVSQDPPTGEQRLDENAGPTKRGRGRPRRSSLSMVEETLAGAEARFEESVRPTTEVEEVQSQSDSQRPKSSKLAKRPPSQRDPKARVSSVKNSRSNREANQDGANGVVRDQTRAGSTLSRSNWRAMSKDPDADDGAQRTRSGRAAVRPLAFWRNEKVKYSDDQSKAQIIRTEEVTAPKRRPGRPKGSKAPRSGARSASALVDEAFDEPPEEWEENEGVVVGPVLKWNAETAESGEPGGDEDVVESGKASKPPAQIHGSMGPQKMRKLTLVIVVVAPTELAYASVAMQTQEVANSTFRYAKTLAMDFFGSGVVDVPPQGFKRPKKSRKMQMVFYVFEGKVLVDVAGNQFRIGRGGMWQVPRGNIYSIQNDYDKMARIFFAQGCEKIAGAPGQNQE
ncbi:MAG: hypothetical protein M1825_001871 [Sarcosagium campestre]|nr:MAG: hypothetical protein M1825_001871 [Sarcosagium campestre]